MSKILIDIDGVVADFKGAFLDELQLKDSNPESWDFLESLKPKDKKEAEALMNDLEFWGGLPLIDGAKKAVKRLKAIGHEVVWVTSPWPSCIGWETARRSWIKDNFGDDDVIVTSSKHHIDGDFFIDDKPENVEVWKKAHPYKKAFIYDQTYNRHYHGAPRFDWSKVGILL